MQGLATTGDVEGDAGHHSRIRYDYGDVVLRLRVRMCVLLYDGSANMSVNKRRLHSRVRETT
jgi:hypothetical protein